MASAILTIWTIYDHPKDYPEFIVVRPLKVERGLVRPGPALICKTLEDARKMIPLGLVRVRRAPHDDPCIVECWL